MQFTMLETLFDPDMKSEYVKGHSYTIRGYDEYNTSGWDDKKKKDVKARCELLPQKVKQWIADGKAMLGGLPAGVSGGN